MFQSLRDPKKQKTLRKTNTTNESQSRGSEKTKNITTKNNNKTTMIFREPTCTIRWIYEDHVLVVFINDCGLSQILWVFHIVFWFLGPRRL
jgi:hypothetical protein